MINWDPAALTALSDEEVIPTSQKSTLYYVRYESSRNRVAFWKSRPHVPKQSWPTPRSQLIRAMGVIAI